jgi:hypothetical protein
MLFAVLFRSSKGSHPRMNRIHVKMKTCRLMNVSVKSKQHANPNHDTLMTSTLILGFPRIGANSELKFAWIWNRNGSMHSPRQGSTDRRAV